MVQEKIISVCRGKAWIAMGFLLAGLVQTGFAQERPVRIPLHQALEKYLPNNYQFNSDGVDLSTDITYDASLPWAEAFNKGLTNSGLEMQTNLFKRIVVIKKSKAGAGHPTYAAYTTQATNATNTVAFSAGAPALITIQQALAKYVPGDYGISIANEIDPKTMIAYDTTLPWMEALGKGLTAVGIDMNANMSKKNIAVMPFQTTLVEVIEKQVPADYKVFLDADIKADTRMRYEESMHWIEALSKGARAAGIDVTVNVTRKLVFIKSMNVKNS